MADDSVLYIVTLGRGEENTRIDPFPGSEEAFEQGCTCPVNQPWPGQYAFGSDCPIHELVPSEDKPN